MRFLELKFPPLLFMIFIGWLMWLASAYGAMFGRPLPVLKWLAVVPVVAGVAIAVFGVISFRRAQTTVNPMRPDASSVLVTSGIYTRTRNPMYLGSLLVLIGWALFLTNALALLFLPAFVAYMNVFQIGPEEVALAKRFGIEFADYRSRVRRWL